MCESGVNIYRERSIGKSSSVCRRLSLQKAIGERGFLRVSGEQREFKISIKPQNRAGIRERVSEGQRLVQGHFYAELVKRSRLVEFE